MQWAQHGEYRLHRQGRVLVVCTQGTWNEVAVCHLARDLQPWFKALAPEPWGLCVDARLWDGGTPEATRCWQRDIEDAALAHGLQATATILPTRFHAALVREPTRRLRSLCLHHQGLDAAEAWRWLAAQGLDVGECSG